MTAVALLKDLQRNDIRLTATGDRLHYDAPRETMTEALLTLMQHQKPALLTLLELFEERAGIIEYDGGVPRAEAERVAWQCVLGERAMTATALIELTRAAAILNTAPYNAPPEKLTKAVALVRDGTVQREDADHWLVARASGAYWTVTRGVCNCPQSTHSTRWCKHAVAVELSQRVEQRLTSFTQMGAQRHTGPELHDTFPREEDRMSTSSTLMPETARLVAAGGGNRLPRRSIQAILADLSRPLPPACVAERKQGGQTIPFLRWWTVATILDTYAPGWVGEVRTLTMLGERCVVTYRLTIPCAEGEVWREDVGREEEEDPAYGDPVTNAKAIAFKRCAAQFGLGRWLYEKDHLGEALAKHLGAEKAQLLDEVGKQLDVLQLDRQQIITRLRAETGAAKNRDIPIAALQAILWQLATAPQTLRATGARDA